MTKSAKNTKRVTVAKLTAAIVRWGGALEVDEGGRRCYDVYQAVAPRGFHWYASGSVHMVASRDAEGRADLLDRVSFGIEKCNDPNCGCDED